MVYIDFGCYHSTLRSSYLILGLRNTPSNGCIFKYSRRVVRILHEVPGSELISCLPPIGEWTPEGPRFAIGVIMKACLWSSGAYAPMWQLLVGSLIPPKV